MKLIPPLADKSENPVLRGYWNDQELLSWTGAGSIAVVKNMQRELLLKSRLEKSESGQNARAWNIGDVLRVGVAVDLVRETGFNLAVCTRLLGMLGKKSLDAATSSAAIGAAMSEFLSERKSERRLRQALPAILQIERPDLVQLAIVDRNRIYSLTRADEGRAFESTCIGKLLNIASNPPEVSRIVKNAPQLLPDDLIAERSVLRIKLANLAEHSLQLLRSHLHAA